MTQDTNTQFRVFLHPLENLQFRDGRPLEAGFLHRSQLPSPQTLTGAMRLALMQAVGINPKSYRVPKELEKEKSEDVFRALVKSFDQAWIADVQFRGPWLVRRYPKRWNRPADLMLPIPAAIQRIAERNQWVTLRPLADSLSWRTKVGQCTPMWHAESEPAESVDGFISLAAMEQYLGHESGFSSFEDFANDRYNEGWYATREQLVTDVRAIGIARDMDRKSAEKSKLYAPGELSFPMGIDTKGEACPSTCFYAELVAHTQQAKKGLADCLPKISAMTFGGQGGEVLCEKPAASDVWEPASFETSQLGEQLVLVATSPVISRREIPDALTRLQSKYQDAFRVVSACVPRVIPVSGWDSFRRCPQPNRFTAAAGSCYFVEVSSEEAKDSIQKLSSLSTVPYAQHGWGTFMIGNYRPINLGLSSLQRANSEDFDQARVTA